MSEDITLARDEELHGTEEVELNLPELSGVTGNKKDAEGQDVLDADGNPIPLTKNGFCCQCLGLPVDENGDCPTASIPTATVQMMNIFLDASLKPYMPALDMISAVAPSIPEIPLVFKPPVPPIEPLPPIPAIEPPEFELAFDPSVEVQMPAITIPDPTVPFIDFMMGCILFPFNLLIDASLALLEIPPAVPSLPTIPVPLPIEINGSVPPIAGCFGQALQNIFAAVGLEPDPEAIEAKRLETKEKLEGMYPGLENIARDEDQESTGYGDLTSPENSAEYTAFQNALSGTAEISIEESDDSPEYEGPENGHPNWPVYKNPEGNLTNAAGEELAEGAAPVPKQRHGGEKSLLNIILGPLPPKDGNDPPTGETSGPETPEE